jgi:hypothetical protein
MEVIMKTSSNLVVSVLTKELLSHVLVELPASAFSAAVQLRFENVRSMLDAGIAVYLIEWEGDEILQSVLPGVSIGFQCVGVVEGGDVWSVDAYIFATVSELISYEPNPCRHKYLLY